MDVALGFSVHTGWAAAVVISGDATAPTVHDRRRVDLLPPDVERFAYHLVQDWPIDKAKASVAKARRAVDAMAKRVLDELVGVAEVVGSPVGMGVTGLPGTPLPALDRILGSHTLLHTAEGELYRGALLDAAARHDLPVTAIHQKRGVADVATALGRDPERFNDRLADLRAEIGAPWTTDHKLATAAALLALDVAAAAPADEPLR